jgi:hypothetical protein
MNSAVYSPDERPESSVFGLVLRAIGGLAVVAIFFFGTLFVLDYFYLPYPDYVRANDARMIKAALERYRSAKGGYPSLYPGNQLTDLNKDLVGGGFIARLPSDPVYGAGVDGGYLYASDGLKYGLLLHLKFATGQIKAGGACLTGVGYAGSGWWGQPPDCPF